MTPRDKKIIAQIQDRVRSGDCISELDDEGQESFRPVTRPALAAAEKQLGFALPELLRGIYLQTGEGVGPGYGLLPIQRRVRDTETLVAAYDGLRALGVENSEWHWPKKLVPICTQGCGMYSCVDCMETKLPVLIFDPSNLDESEEDKDEAALRWTNSFWAEAPSLSVWFELWLSGVPKTDPSWPSRSWLKRRLWPKKPWNVARFFKS